MRSEMAKTLLGIIVCTCLLPAGLWAQEDPNAPWDPNTHLAPYPRICTLSTDYYTPEHEYGEGNWTAFDRKIELSGKIAVTDPNGLIGLSKYPTDVLVWNDIGTPLDPVSSGEPPLVYLPLEYAATIWVPTMEHIVDSAPYDVSVDLRQAPESPFPASLSRVEWSMSALLSDRFETIDIPFAETDDWVEIAPGLEVLIEQTVVADDRYDYRIKSRFDPNKVVHPDYRARTSAPPREEGYRWSDQRSPEMVVIAVEVLDAQGNSVHYQGSGGVLSVVRSMDDFEDPAVVTRIETGRCDACSQAAFLRHTVAYAPYEQEVRLAMDDVTLPPQ